MASWPPLNHGERTPTPFHSHTGSGISNKSIRNAGSIQVQNSPNSQRNEFYADCPHLGPKMSRTWQHHQLQTLESHRSSYPINHDILICYLFYRRPPLAYLRPQFTRPTNPHRQPSFFMGMELGLVSSPSTLKAYRNGSLAAGYPSTSWTGWEWAVPLVISLLK
jgi:hypothetical protein